jgi:hypothetical protein
MATTILVAVTAFDTDQYGARLVASVPAPKSGVPAATSDDRSGVVLCVGQTRTALLSEEMANEFRQFPLKNAAPFLVFQLRDPGTGKALTVGGLRATEGCVAGVAECAGCRVASGRLPDPDDKRWVLLKSDFADARKLTTGGKLTVAGETFTVRSVVDPVVRPVEADIYMQIDDARRIAGKQTGGGSLEGKINVLLVEVEKRGERSKAIRLIKERHPELVFSGYAHDKPLKAMGLPIAVAWLVILVIALFAMAWATRSQVSSVTERRPDIAVLKGVGWTDGNLTGLMFMETGIQAVWASIFGLIVVSMVFEHAPVGSLSGLNCPVAFSSSPWVVLVGLLVSLTGWMAAGGISALEVASILPLGGGSQAPAS